MKKISFISLLLLGSIALNAQNVSEADASALNKIKQANENNISIISSFKQIKHMPILGENILSNGSFYYNKPEQLAMIYEDPKGDLLIISNDKMTMVTSGKRREASTKSNAKTRGIKNILASFIQGDVMQVGADKISVQEKGSHIVVTTDMGKNNKNNITKVIGSYDKTDMTIVIIRTEEADGTHTTYELTDKQVNKPIDQSVFKAPKK